MICIIYTNVNVSMVCRNVNISSATWAARWHLFKGKPMQHEATKSYGYVLLFSLSSNNSHTLFKAHMMREDSWGKMWESLSLVGIEEVSFGSRKSPCRPLWSIFMTLSQSLIQQPDHLRLQAMRMFRLVHAAVKLVFAYNIIPYLMDFIFE